VANNEQFRRVIQISHKVSSRIQESEKLFACPFASLIIDYSGNRERRKISDINSTVSVKFPISFPVIRSSEDRTEAMQSIYTAIKDHGIADKLFLSLLLFFLLVSPSLAKNIKTRLVTDQMGRKIAIPVNPMRVIALAPSITEIIFELGQGERLKGVTQFSDSPPQAHALPKVGSYIHLDIERIVALNPDLCIAIKDGNPRYVVYKLQELGIPVYVVNPRNLSSVIETVLEIGYILNANKEAQSVAKEMRNEISRIKGIVAKAQRKPKVFFQIGISPIVAVGSNTFINELITLAGGINVTAGPNPYPRFSIEQVLFLKPDIIIITSMARGSTKLFESAKNQWEKWPEIPACRNHRIFLVDSNLVDRPTPRLVQGLRMLLKIIHPELCGENQWRPAPPQ